jgi:DNA-binding CsgD family transcriptional regulator/tetratricopeptide (TPR) repeat protein
VEWQGVVTAHELAGDKAQAHHLFDDAAQHYQEALNVPNMESLNHARISEKLAYALSFGHNPIAANPLFDRVLASYLGNPIESSKAIEILLRRARQLWIGASTKSALPLIEQAMRIAETSMDPGLCKLAYGQMANYLLLLDRYEDAEPFVRAAKDIDGGKDNGNIQIQRGLTMRDGIVAAAFGDIARAFECFDEVVVIAKKAVDVYQVTNIWHTYGFWATELGNINLAKNCYKQALLVARQFHIAWYIPLLCLEYARVMSLTGQYQTAHEYTSDALAYDTSAAITETLFVDVGIPIALHAKDELILKRCARGSVVDLAFRSGQPTLIAPVAAAFAEWHVWAGRAKEARALLHRTITTLNDFEHIEQVWTFPIAVARFGRLSDITRARRFVEARAALPCAEVARATLSLFDAIAAQRRSQQGKAQNSAVEAVARFEALGWYGYAHLAHALLPAGTPPLVPTNEGAPFATVLPLLTRREQEVAELVLKGLTNRTIAAELSIKERTVEAHLTSIMSHLGVRSRYQIVEHLAEP